MIRLKVGESKVKITILVPTCALTVTSTEILALDVCAHLTKEDDVQVRVSHTPPRIRAEGVGSFPPKLIPSRVILSADVTGLLNCSVLETTGESYEKTYGFAVPMNRL
jgi:hypothetical protein